MTSNQTKPIPHSMTRFDEYRQIDRMNGSTLVHGLTSMLALRHAIDSGYESTDSMRFGSQMHCLLLEPDEFTRTHRVMPDYAKDHRNIDAKDRPSTSGNTSWCRDKKRMFYRGAEQEGFAVMEQSKYDTALSMIEAIRAKRSANMWYEDSDREVTLLGEIEGVEFKGRVDLLGRALIDVKGTNSVRPTIFGSTFARLNYDFKLSIYRELVRKNLASTNRLNQVEPDVYIIAVEDTPPHDVCVYPIEHELLDVAMDNVCRVIRQYKECLASGVWPGVDGDEDYIDLRLPSWKTATEDKVDWESVGDTEG